MKGNSDSHTRDRCVRICVPLLSTTAFYLLIQGFVLLAYAPVEPAPVLFLDWLFQLSIGYLLFAFARRIVVFCVAQFMFMTTIYLGHAIHMFHFGSPLTVDDILSLPALFGVLSVPLKCLLAFPFVALFASLCFNLKFHKVASPAAIAAVLGISALLFSFPRHVVDIIESHYDVQEWDQHHNYRVCGGTTYLVYKGARFWRDRVREPTREDVAAVLANLNAERNRAPEKVAFEQRDVLLLVVEGLWDPSLLKNVTCEQDPFAPEFRALWEEGGPSWAMSPVFGGRTPNAEFEILTGHPANLYDGRVMFQTNVRNNTPALPRLFSEHGYDSIACHPFLPSFWNRHNVYPRLGFDFYYSMKHFDMDDAYKKWLSDISFYRQSLRIVREKHQEKPLFLYLLTIKGHTPYYLDWKRRPRIVRSDTKLRLVDRYLSLVRYTTTETMQLIRATRKKNPDTLIVIVGDHLPQLGPRFQAYVEAGLLTPSLDDFTPQMYRTYVSTPLLIIDGENGPVDVGTVAMYEIPHIMLRLLNCPTSQPIDVFQPPQDVHVRPMDGLILIIDENDEEVVCRTGEESEICGSVKAWIEQLKVLDSDVLMGKQFLLDYMNRDRL
jgi:phosphoglycerol transferase MdoB-like AlkP superfamily enzyme